MIEQEPLAENEDIYALIMAQVRTALISTRALTPSESACGSAYSNATQQIVERMKNATNICFENANRTQTSNTQSANATAIVLRRHLMTVSNETLRCSNLTDVYSLANCTVATVSLFI